MSTFIPSAQMKYLRDRLASLADPGFVVGGGANPPAGAVNI